MEIENNGIKYWLTEREINKSELIKNVYENEEDMIDYSIEEDTWNLIYNYLTEDIIDENNELILKSLEVIIMFNIISLIELIIIKINNGKFTYEMLLEYYSVFKNYAELKWIVDLYFLSLYKPIENFEQTFRKLSRSPFSFKIKPYMLTTSFFLFKLTDSINIHKNYRQIQQNMYGNTLDFYCKNVCKHIKFALIPNDLIILDLTNLDGVKTIFSNLPNDFLIYEINCIYFTSNFDFQKNKRGELVPLLKNTSFPSKHKPICHVSHLNNKNIIIKDDKIWISQTNISELDQDYLYTENYVELKDFTVE